MHDRMVSTAPGLLAAEPGARLQWHLANTGQGGGTPGIDLNILGAWADYAGRGVRIGVVDDGFDMAHPDLAATLRPGWDSLSADAWPAAEGADRHGTTTAGIIGADDNGAGLLGVAPDASLFGFRIGFGTHPLAMYADALARQAAMDVSSNSWGFTVPFSDDLSGAAFQPLAEALAQAAAFGRGGLGTVWVMSAGNERQSGDSINHHGFGGSEFAMAVAALDPWGAAAIFSNPGSGLFVTAPGVRILTTDRPGSPGYSDGETAVMNGTSYAAPMVAGVAALMLEANPGLGYRDVQAIIAASARPVDTANPSWTTNGAATWNGGGMRFSTDHGFGLVDATAAVRLAETWFATAATASTFANRAVAEARWQGAAAIPDGDANGIALSLALAADIAIERIELDVDIAHGWIGDLAVSLVSPEGTAQTLLARPGVAPGGGGYGLARADLAFTLPANGFRGEDAAGTWTVRVADQAWGEAGFVRGLVLRAIGAEASGDDTYVYTDAFALLAEPARRLLADAGGRDTLNAASVGTACSIDLGSGACVIAGVALAIAAGTVIENAIGGDGADRISGNAAANTLWGGRGADALSGLDGDDVLKGGAGADTLDGGAGFDHALFDIARASARLSWDGATLLVDDGAGIDRLSGIEFLVFADEVVDIASLAQPDLAAAIRLTNTTPGTTGAGLAWAGVAQAPGGSQVLGAAQLGIDGVASAQVTLASGADGALSVRLDSAWNSVKAVRVADADGGRISVANFVEAVVDLTGATRDSTIEVLLAKRGAVTGGAGADAIAVRSLSNNFDGGNTITVDGGDGADLLTLSATSARTIFRAEGGAGDDRIVITGASADIVNGGAGDDRIDAGAGNDRISGGAGADIFVLRAGSGRDAIFDFTPGQDRIEFQGVAAEAVAIALLSTGVRLSWGTDIAMLSGPRIAQFSAADLAFA